MSDFDMVGHCQVAFFMPVFATVSRGAATWFCRGRPQLLRKTISIVLI